MGFATADDESATAAIKIKQAGDVYYDRDVVPILRKSATDATIPTRPVAIIKCMSMSCSFRVMGSTKSRHGRQARRKSTPRDGRASAETVHAPQESARTQQSGGCDPACLDQGGALPSKAPAGSNKIATRKHPPRGPVKQPAIALAYSPNDSLIAVGGYQRVQLLDAKSSLIQHELTGISGNVTVVSFDQTGKFIVAAGGVPGKIGQAIVWEIATGKKIAEFVGHKDSLHAMAISPDNRTLATAGYDKDIRLWNLFDAIARPINEPITKSLFVLTGHNDAVYDLAFRGDGKVLASASGDRTIKLWNVATGSRLDTLSEATKDQYSVTFHPTSGRLYAAGIDNRIRMWQTGADAKEGSNILLEARYAHNSPILRIRHSKSGDMLVSVAQDRSLKVWDSQRLTERLQGDIHPSVPATVSLSHQQPASVLVGRQDGTIALVDSSTARSSRTSPPRRRHRNQSRSQNFLDKRCAVYRPASPPTFAFQVSTLPI